MSYMLIDLKKKIHALMFKVIKSIHIFESTIDLFMNKFSLIFDFK